MWVGLWPRDRTATDKDNGGHSVLPPITTIGSTQRSLILAHFGVKANGRCPSSLPLLPLGSTDTSSLQVVLLILALFSTLWSCPLPVLAGQVFFSDFWPSQGSRLWLLLLSSPQSSILAPAGLSGKLGECSSTLEEGEFHSDIGMIHVYSKMQVVFRSQIQNPEAKLV